MIDKIVEKFDCFVQGEMWRSLAKRIEKNECPRCKKTEVRVVSKWRARCKACDSDFRIKRPSNFPKNMNDTRNWKAKCDECGGVMDYYNFKYGCRKCGHILEV